MLFAKGNTLSIPQGDSGELHLRGTTVGGDPLVFQPGDVVCFATNERANTPSATPAIYKEVRLQEPKDVVTIYFAPEDTQHLTGTFKYDLKVVTAAGRVDTIVRDAIFTILPAVFLYGEAGGVEP